MNLTDGSPRVNLAAADVAKLRAAGTLIEDARRQRPRYFDGRFLAARDLTRDQQYFLTREADLGQASGSGVANGLAIGAGGDPGSLRIAPGDGVTPAGELVMIERALEVRLADIAQTEALSARFGLGRIPQPPLRSRHGLFVLCLRPVEFTANPIGAYPTSITGPRTVEDGDVIEATAVVLVPWPDDGGSDDLDRRRSLAARAIFVDRERRALSANLLPLAMLGVQNNQIAWIDAPMVRRELGADRADLPGLGLAPRALRLAQLLQYQGQLADVGDALGTRRYAASTQFAVLPPAGPLPANVIVTSDFTQGFFPAQIDVDFMAIPEDELPALIEESLALPPIDLSLPAEQLDSVSVVIAAPVPRADWNAVSASLESRLRTIKATAPNLVAQRKPLEILQRLRIPTVAPAPSVADAAWAKLAAGSLWYLRRRNLAYRDDLVGVSLRLNRPMLRVPMDLGLKTLDTRLLAQPQVTGTISPDTIKAMRALSATTLTRAATPGAVAAPTDDAGAATARAEAARLEAQRSADAAAAAKTAADQAESDRVAAAQSADAAAKSRAAENDRIARAEQLRVAADQAATEKAAADRAARAQAEKQAQADAETRRVLDARKAADDARKAESDRAAARAEAERKAQADAENQRVVAAEVARRAAAEKAARDAAEKKAADDAARQDTPVRKDPATDRVVVAKTPTGRTIKPKKPT